MLCILADILNGGDYVTDAIYVSHLAYVYIMIVFSLSLHNEYVFSYVKKQTHSIHFRFKVKKKILISLSKNL